jgi:heptosyltransferase-2
MKSCDAVICGDTGPMHIAEALNVPLIAIFGSTVKEFGFYPQSENSVVIENKELGCRPCTHIGRSSCPLGHFKCMKEIEPEKIVQSLKLEVKS